MAGVASRVRSCRGRREMPVFLPLPCVRNRRKTTRTRRSSSSKHGVSLLFFFFFFVFFFFFFFLINAHHVPMRAWVRTHTHQVVLHTRGITPLINSRSSWSRAPIDGGGLISENKTRFDSSIELNYRSNRFVDHPFYLTKYAEEKLSRSCLFNSSDIGEINRGSRWLDGLGWNDRFKDSNIQVAISICKEIEI